MNPSLKYFLRYCLTWLFEFWLRPLDMLDEIQQKNLNNIPFFTGIVNGLIWLFPISWGAYYMLCVVIYTPIKTSTLKSTSSTLCTPNAHILHLVATPRNREEPLILATIFGLQIGSFTVSGVIAVFFVAMWIFGTTNGFDGVKSVIFSGFSLTLICSFGILLGLYLSTNIIIGLIYFFTIIIIIIFLKDAFLKKRGIETPSWIVVTLMFSQPASIFALFTITEIIKIPIFGYSIISAIAIGIVIGFYSKLIRNRQFKWLIIFWGLFLILATICNIYSYFTDADLSNKLTSLIPFFIITPVIATGLPLWLFMALITLWQYRTKNSNAYNEQKFLLTAPFRWQTFAYPLPSLANYLFKVGQINIKNSLAAIQLTQAKTLQDKAVRTAIKQLATEPTTAVNFCSEYILKFNATPI